MSNMMKQNKSGDRNASENNPHNGRRDQMRAAALRENLKKRKAQLTAGSVLNTDKLNKE